MMKSEDSPEITPASRMFEQQAAALREANDRLQSEIVRRQRVEDELRRHIDRAEPSRRAMLSVMEDQKQAEETLRISLSRHQALLAAVPDIIMEVDNRKVYTWANQAGLEFFGKDVVGKEAAHFFEGEQGTYDAVAPLFSGDERVIYVESWQRRQDGQKRLLAWWCRTYKDKDGVVIGALSTARDITDRTRIEDALRESEKQLRLTLDSARAVAWVGELVGGVITEIGPVAEVFGQPAGFRHTDQASFIESIHPDDRARVIAILEAGEQGETNSYSMEFRVPLADGGVRWLHATGSFEGVVKGRPTRVRGITRDITARKRAEEALRESEEKLRLFIEHAPAALAMFDRDMRYLAVSRRWTADFKLGDTDLLGRSHYEVFPDVSDALRAVHRRGLAGEVVKSDGASFKRADGSVQSLKWEMRPWYDSEGRIGGIVIFSEDITERKKAEEALRASEGQLSNALQMARAGHWEYDVGSDTFTFNDSFYRIFRTTAEQMGGYKMSSADYARRFCHPDDAAMVANETRVAIEAADPNFNRQIEHRILYADGQAGYITVRIFIVKDSQGRTVKTYGVNQDITERKRVENALRESEEEFRAMFEVASIGMAQADIVTGQWLRVNRRMCEITGYSADELLRLRVPEITHPEDRQADWDAFQRVVRGEASNYRMEKRYIRKDGTMIWVNVNMTVTRNAAGQPLRTMATIENISERKQTEEMLNRQMDELRRWHEVTLGREERIAELKREVNKLAERAGEKPKYGGSEK